ncbi:hypothetical protein [Microbaculum marinum]|uniref:Uncharacterized protein n=1 Tax=Microbaculum marinum TaxID=1764581 RepID=A0AAW9RWP0_9HYPH
MNGLHSDAKADNENYNFFVVILILYIGVALLIFLIANAVPASKDTEDFANLESRLISLEHELSSDPEYESTLSTTGDKTLDSLILRVAILENRVLESEKRVSDRYLRMERGLSEAQSSFQWQVAIIWGIIVALTAAIIPLKISSRGK